MLGEQEKKFILNFMAVLWLYLFDQYQEKKVFLLREATGCFQKKEEGAQCPLLGRPSWYPLVRLCIWCHTWTPVLMPPCTPSGSHWSDPCLGAVDKGDLKSVSALDSCCSRDKLCRVLTSSKPNGATGTLVAAHDSGGCLWFLTSREAVALCWCPRTPGHLFLVPRVVVLKFGCILESLGKATEILMPRTRLWPIKWYVWDISILKSNSHIICEYNLGIIYI